jgi:hypothetical protein
MLDGSTHWKEHLLNVSRKCSMHYCSGTFGFERASLCWCASRHFFSLLSGRRAESWRLAQGLQGATAPDSSLFLSIDLCATWRAVEEGNGLDANFVKHSEALRKGGVRKKEMNAGFKSAGNSSFDSVWKVPKMNHLHLLQRMVFPSPPLPYTSRLSPYPAITTRDTIAVYKKKNRQRY